MRRYLPRIRTLGRISADEENNNYLKISAFTASADGAEIFYIVGKTAVKPVRGKK